MKNINKYINFNGNCKSAMEFYKECLNGRVDMMTFKDSPMKDQIPPEQLDLVLHSALFIDDQVVLMASDSDGKNPVTVGNNISLFIDCSSEEELNRFFNNLSKDAKTVMPIEKQFWGSQFGMLIDKFGISWMMAYEPPKQ